MIVTRFSRNDILKVYKLPFDGHRWAVEHKSPDNSATRFFDSRQEAAAFYAQAKEYHKQELREGRA